MSFLTDWFTMYSNLADETLLRVRTGVRKVRKGTYTADNWIHDVADTNLKAVELAIKPYGFVLQPESAGLNRHVQATTTAPSVFILPVASVQGNAPSLQAVIAEKSGKTITIDAVATAQRDGLIITVPALSGSGVVANEVYEGAVAFGAAGDSPTAIVRIEID